MRIRIAVSNPQNKLAISTHIRNRTDYIHGHTTDSFNVHAFASSVRLRHLVQCHTESYANLLHNKQKF